MTFDIQTATPVDPAILDRDLLAEYQHSGAETVFLSIVERYSRLVFSVCLRNVNDVQAAEDASQAVFLIFAQRARTLKPDIVLAAWFA